MTGSISWEILAPELVERLPVMITPRRCTKTQPIALDDELVDLVGVLVSRPDTIGEVYDIGGPEVLTRST